MIPSQYNIHTYIHPTTYLIHSLTNHLCPIHHPASLLPSPLLTNMSLRLPIPPPPISLYTIAHTYLSAYIHHSPQSYPDPPRTSLLKSPESPPIALTNHKIPQVWLILTLSTPPPPPGRSQGTAPMKDEEGCLAPIPAPSLIRPTKQASIMTLMISLSPPFPPPARSLFFLSYPSFLPFNQSINQSIGSLSSSTPPPPSPICTPAQVQAGPSSDGWLISPAPFLI